MGSKCSTLCGLCENPINDTVKYLQSRSENQWVRKLQLEKSQKIIVVAPSQTEPEKSHYALHSESDYSKGIIFVDRTFYEGDINNEHMANGKGLQRFLLKQNNEEKECYYQGQFQNNRRHGKGKYVDNFIQFEGTWKSGYPIKGIYEVTQNQLHKTQSKKLFKIENMSFNNPEMTTGTGTIILPDKTKYIGEFVKLLNNKYAIQGKGIMYFDNSDRFDGQFKGGKYHGQGIYTWRKAEKKFEGLYKDGVKNGKGKLFLNKNKYLEGMWVNGKKQGNFEIFERQSSGNFIRLDSFDFENDKMKQK